MSRFSRKGFTLVELLVVMAIIASLLTLAMPRYFHSVDRSREAVLRQDLHIMRDAIDKFMADRGRYPLTLEELAEKRYLRKDGRMVWVQSTVSLLRDETGRPRRITMVRCARCMTSGSSEDTRITASPCATISAMSW